MRLFELKTNVGHRLLELDDAMASSAFADTAANFSAGYVSTGKDKSDTVTAKAATVGGYVYISNYGESTYQSTSPAVKKLINLMFASYPLKLSTLSKQERNKLTEQPAEKKAVAGLIRTFPFYVGAFIDDVMTRVGIMLEADKTLGPQFEKFFGKTQRAWHIEMRRQLEYRLDTANISLNVRNADYGAAVLFANPVFHNYELQFAGSTPSSIKKHAETVATQIKAAIDGKKVDDAFKILRNTVTIARALLENWSQLSMVMSPHAGETDETVE